MWNFASCRKKENTRSHMTYITAHAYTYLYAVITTDIGVRREGQEEAAVSPPWKTTALLK